MYHPMVQVNLDYMGCLDFRDVTPTSYLRSLELSATEVEVLHYNTCCDTVP